MVAGETHLNVTRILSTAVTLGHVTIKETKVIMMMDSMHTMAGGNGLSTVAR